MKSIAIFLLFLGTVLIIQGYYDNLTKNIKPKTVIKYVPRSTYEEQMMGPENLDSYFKTIFEQNKIN
jgi:hypothetical protein